MSSKLLLDVCYIAQVAPSGECLRGEGLVRLIADAYVACGSFFLRQVVRHNTRKDHMSRSCSLKVQKSSRTNNKSEKVRIFRIPKSFI